MSEIITFKAGRCDLEGKKVKPVATPGYLYLHIQDEILHFSWRQRSAPSWDPELDLLMFPGDCTFLPYLGPGVSTETAGDKTSPINGRIFELKFSSSSQRHYFWLQSKSQHKDGKSNWFSKRDLLLGEIVNKLLTDDDADITPELGQLRSSGGGSSGGSGGDVAMEDAQGGGPATSLARDGGTGAGSGGPATGPSLGGQPGSGAHGGGSANDDPNSVVQNFLRSLQGSNDQSRQSQSDNTFTSLTELFDPSTNIAHISSASNEQIDKLCSHLPASIFLLSQEAEDSLAATEPTPQAGQAAIEALSTSQKREILERIARSPQLHQSLGSLTIALRDGGLPQIGEALGLNVENGGIIKGGAMPVGGSEAVQKFLEGVRRTVEKK